ncbi:arginyl-tRNA synthetase [Rhodoligotrophos appendicifer]|uniref:arginine--tRNA ligase n=1 Tax=Rhodoligotrophos appendicifer TaxID=987056 RepID=UPI00118506CB|nr:arginine--tRNA ligase [Rhodoligotrophos appendicifer]
MNLFAHFHAVVNQAVHRLIERGRLPSGLDLSRIVVEPPRESTHGDVSTNAAMVLAKAASKNPREIAVDLALELQEDADVASAEVAGPGFVNLRLRATFWPKVVAAVLEARETYGAGDIGRGLSVNVEYVSANPTGPLHVGHCRGAVFGDALANLLAETGHQVTREYYINDAGAQIDVLAQSAFLRYREALGDEVGEIPSGLYPGDYLKPVGAELAKRYGSDLRHMAKDEALRIVRDFAVSAMMELIKEDLSALKITHEEFFSEASLHDTDIAEMISEFKARNLVYLGNLPPPKGQPSEEWEDREQLLFRASKYGDDIDRPLQKSDGSYTYFAADVAYFRSKFRRGFAEMIYVLGADHGGYVKRLEAVGRAIAGDQARVIVRLCQLVRLFRDGEPIRMSKRSGDFVTLREVVDEVGADVVRFMMLYRKNDAPLDFDFSKVTEQSRDNPVFYVQYAHARICSVLRNAELEFGPQVNDQVSADDLSLLTDEAEVAVIRRLADYPRIQQSAVAAHEPHRIAHYLYDLASDFHSLWNRGKESPHLRFIVTQNVNATNARLAMLRAIRYALQNGLRIIGVTPMVEM